MEINIKSYLLLCNHISKLHKYKENPYYIYDIFRNTVRVNVPIFSTLIPTVRHLSRWDTVDASTSFVIVCDLSGCGTGFASILLKY